MCGACGSPVSPPAISRKCHRLAPITTEVKDCRYTRFRSTLVKHSANLHPHAKHLALDGRLRALPDTEKDRYCTLYFAVSRATEPDDEGINMLVDYCKVDLQIRGHVPGAKGVQTIERSHDKLPGVPIMTNPKKARAGREDREGSSV